MSTQNDSTRYFNVHTEAAGYINALKEVPGQKGSFWASKFTCLEGHPDKVEKVYIDFTIPGEDVLDVLGPYKDQINAATQVFAVIRYAKFRATPFIYPQGSQNAGKMGVNYTAKLIKVLFLKVGDQVVFDHRNEVEAAQAQQQLQAEADQSRPVQASQDKVQAPAVPVTTTAPAANAGLFNPPLTVKLSKDDANFEETKERLKEQGYGWNAEIGLWTLKVVSLQKSDPAFNSKKSELQSHGYRWDNGSKSWKMAFQRGGQRQAAAGNSSYAQH